ncbi:hypothetical protein DC3_12530 [Deinococcus cellulosilyticus NBRC 106333 = KACC 11606]|uniref:Uncharacterized protein n=1 Tax=Deinococcus cellulosilyticus (strain DSM 18568 / NBRC 106333 / KACC 11606 / 5516J-15) TaxID=1223518 RepID=A0A511MZC1_DEIC1|nr:hypothetical protein DC3_12530 [Deinococcus cellulosilyticus NBRC 106333 = KACC 11606]
MGHPARCRLCTPGFILRLLTQVMQAAIEQDLKLNIEAGGDLLLARTGGAPTSIPDF